MFPNWFQTQQHFFERNVPNTNLRVLQIGTYTGDATEWLLNNRDVISIADVDTWEGSEEDAHHSIDFSSVEEYYDSRFSNNEKVHKFKSTSDKFFIEWPLTTYNFIYIDGDHTAIQTALDGLNAFRLLEPGGVMAFDDYQWTAGGEGFLIPKRGVEAVLSVCTGKYELIDSGYQIWIKKC
jgi:predicted O-methyltransferase YrrM